MYQRLAYKNSDLLIFVQKYIFRHLFIIAMCLVTPLSIWQPCSSNRFSIQCSLFELPHMCLQSCYSWQKQTNLVAGLGVLNFPSNYT